MANTSKTDYLRFSAYSIKDLITRKLTSDTKFTDQIYEGSNLAILIDIVSYMYQCLLYNVNNAAAESMWADTQIYENINRLCKFIGYNPKGCATPTVTFTFDNREKEEGSTRPKFANAQVLKYSCIDTGKTDSNGKRIYYSTDGSDITIGRYDTRDVLFYNGIWKLYPTIFSGTGNQYQTLILRDLKSDADEQKFVPSDKIDVWIDEGNGKLNKWERTDQGIFSSTDATVHTIYDQNKRIYNVRLNEDKSYEILFGNGSIGKNPPTNAKIYVFYLESNGMSGALTPNEIQGVNIQNSSELFGITQDLYYKLYSKDNFYTGEEGGEMQPTPTQLLLSEKKWSNTTQSTIGANEETVDQIRYNAPEWFKLGNRLVTTDDWEYFVKQCFRDGILDVKCQNNWQYISTFYRWLYNIGIQKYGDGAHYINKNWLNKYDLKYADAADCNNVYLWIKMANDAEIYSDLIDIEVQDIKTVTQEPVYLKPFDVYFTFCAQDVDQAHRYFDSSDKRFDPDNFSYLEVTIDDNTLYSTADLQTQIKNLIIDEFEHGNFKLGQVVNFSDLANKILALGSISRIRTVYHNPASGEERILNGISFATWTAGGIIRLGDDLDVSTTARSLEPFQFPKLYLSQSLASKIKVIKKSISNISQIQY